MELIDEFKKLVNDIFSLTNEKQALFCLDFISDVTTDDLIGYFDCKVHESLSSVINKVVSSPPAVVYEMIEYKGFVLEVSFWYPLESEDSDGYDYSEIHDHSCYIVSKMLKGEGYLEKQYELNQTELNKATYKRNYKFSEGMTRIIKPDDIHSIIYSSDKTSLSIRILLPMQKSIIRVFDYETGSETRQVVSPYERKCFELATILSMLSKDKFKQDIATIRASLSNKSFLNNLNNYENNF